MQLRVNSVGKFVDKDYYPNYDKGKQIERLIKLTGDNPRLNYILTSRAAGMDAIIQPVKRKIEANDKLIRFKLDEPDNPKLINIIFDEERNSWYELSVYMLFIARNEVDGVYGKVEDRASNFYPLSSVLEALDNKTFTMVDEIDYRLPKVFLSVAVEHTGVIPTDISLIKDKMDAENNSIIGVAPIYQVYGQEMNRYLQLFCDENALPPAKVWEEFESIRNFLKQNNCFKVHFNKMTAEVEFSHIYLTKGGKEINRNYVIHIKESNGSPVYLIGDGNIFQKKEAMYRYLKEALTKCKLETRYYKWFGTLDEERDNFDDGIRTMQGRVTIKEERKNFIKFKF